MFPRHITLKVHGSSRALRRCIHRIFPISTSIPLQEWDFVVTTRPFRRVQMRPCFCVMLRAVTLRQPLPISAFVTLEPLVSMTCGLTGWNQRPQLLLLRFGNADLHGRCFVVSSLHQTNRLRSIRGGLVTFVVTHQDARILLAFASNAKKPFPVYVTVTSSSHR